MTSKAPAFFSSELTDDEIRERLHRAIEGRLNLSSGSISTWKDLVSWFTTICELADWSHRASDRKGTSIPHGVIGEVEGFTIRLHFQAPLDSPDVTGIYNRMKSHCPPGLLIEIDWQWCSEHSDCRKVNELGKACYFDSRRRKKAP